MHVKSRQDLDLPVMDLMEDMETDFRQELFGNPTVLSGVSCKVVQGDKREANLGCNVCHDLSENSYSDDDILRFATDCQFSDDLPPYDISNPWRSNSMSSRTSSSSSSFEHNVSDLEYKNYSSRLREDETEVGSDYNVSPIEIMLAKEDLKEEPLSPIHLISGDVNSSYDVWNFLNSEELKPSIKVPETPPVTPPNKSPRLEDSPPMSPISISSIEDGTSIPNRTVITVTQVDALGYENTLAERNKKVPLAPKMPIKVVTTVSANEAKRKFTCSRAIKIQPKMQSTTRPIQRPIIRVIENSPNKISLSSLGLESSSCAISAVPIQSSHDVIKSVSTSHQLPEVMNSTSPIQVTVPIVSSQTSVCSVVPEKRILSLPTIAPALNPLQKNSSLSEFRAMKRQERMIKNRESASLSRKRKKEYLQGLEDEVKELRNENCRLAMENENFQRRLTVLENERELIKASRFPIKRTSSIALMGFTFLILFNMVPLANIIGSSNIKPFGLDTLGKETSGPLVARKDMENKVNLYKRSLLWIPSLDEDDSLTLKESRGNSSTVCPLHINATESLRIENELRDWFESRIDSNKADWIPNQKPLPSMKYPQTPLLKSFHPKTSAGREKTLVTKPKKVEIKEEDRALTSALPLPITLPSYHYIYPHVNEKALPAPMGSEENGATQSVMSLVGNIHTLLESIDRRNDTYYVVSLSSDHLLLPASSHNNSARPKMSLLVPTPRSINDPTSALRNQITLMQIDCEVTHTQLVRIAQSSVPLNRSGFGDVEKKSQETPHGPLPREKFSLKRKRKNRQSLSLD